ncbi:hypothetical protein N0V82_006407 [Gnomoniopsis sp. IMI 355080]|nr:hypothetical protein N0V82_006407 [Gnomoniopsis sp. IMI 355080]
MPALNHAIMIPGLIVISALFLAWIPAWALVWCIRRARGPLSDEEKLKTGNIPHKGFDPAKDADYLRPHISKPRPAASAASQMDKPHPVRVSLLSKSEEQDMKSEEAQTMREEEKRAAALKQQKQNARDERRARRDRREKEEARRKEKGKGRASSVSPDGKKTSGAVTAPEYVVTRDSSRHHMSSRR